MNLIDEFTKDMMPVTYSVLTNKNLKLHKRALAILEMIEICDNRIQDYKNQLKRTPKLYYDGVRNYYTKNIDKHIAIKDRLIRYYADVMVRLTNPIINNAILLGNISIDERGFAISY